MNKIYLIFFIATISSFSCAAFGDEFKHTTNKSGDLVFEVDYISFLPATPGCVHGVFRLDIANGGKDTLRLAKMNGMTIKLNHGNIFSVNECSGLSSCTFSDVKMCKRDSDNYEVIDPGQSISVNCTTSLINDRDFHFSPFSSLSGLLYVENSTSNKVYKRTISINDVRTLDKY